MRSRFLMLTEIISDRISQNNGGSERNPYKSLAGREISIAALRQELQQLGYGEIDWLENLRPLLASGVIIVAADDSGENQLEIDFDVLRLADKQLDQSLIRITNLDKL